MSRSGYTEDMDDMWSFIMWRGAVKSAIRGKRGQKFLKEMLASLDAIPEKKLIAHELESQGAVCAIGAVGVQRGIDMTNLDPEDPDGVANAFGISSALAKEIVYENDEAIWKMTPEKRFEHMREWVVANIRKEDGES